jgi:Flp pilus assembly protein TadG
MRLQRPGNLLTAVSPSHRSLHRTCRGVAATEFALIAPVMLLILFAALDFGRALIAWQEVTYAAEAVVQAAEKLSVVNSTDAVPASLTDVQMQAAMSSIYAEMPGLDKGRGDGWLGPGGYGVTLSEVVYTPVCQATVNCATQIPYPYWSTYLQESKPNSYGMTALNQPPAVLAPPPLRACNAPLTPVGTFPNDRTQLMVMIDPFHGAKSQGNGAALTLPPQLVADVSFTFVPFFSAVFGHFLSASGVTFRASATLPTPIGDTTMPVVAEPTGVFDVKVCAVGLTG